MQECGISTQGLKSANVPLKRSNLWIKELSYWGWKVPVLSFPFHSHINYVKEPFFWSPYNRYLYNSWPIQQTATLALTKPWFWYLLSCLAGANWHIYLLNRQKTRKIFVNSFAGRTKSHKLILHKYWSFGDLLWGNLLVVHNKVVSEWNLRQVFFVSPLHWQACWDPMGLL